MLTLIKSAAATTDAAKGSPTQQVGDYYKAAMDQTRRFELGLKPLEGDLQRIAAGTAADYAALAGRIQAGFGGSPLINVFSMPDAKDSSTRVMLLAPGAQILDQSEYAKPEHQKLRDFYRQYIVTMLNGAGQSIEAAEAGALTVMALETELAAAMMTPLQMRDPANTYNMMSLDEAQALIPALDLRAFLTALGVPTPARLQVFDPKALKAMQKVLAERPGPSRATGHPKLPGQWPSRHRSACRATRCTTPATCPRPVPPCLTQPWRALPKAVSRAW